MRNNKKALSPEQGMKPPFLWSVARRRNRFAWMPTRAGWIKKNGARKINWLESQGGEFVEQPMPAYMIEETRWVRSHVHLPLIADEAAVNAQRNPQIGRCL